MPSQRSAHFVFAEVAGVRTRAFRGAQGVCGICGTAVKGCSGEIIRTPYWKHESLGDCDPWSEGISEWHLKWQDLVREDFREVKLPRPPAKPLHRADIETLNGQVVELQQSFLSPEEIRERELFYGNMVWVFDATNDRFSAAPSGDRVFFSLGRTKHVRLCEKPVFIDFGRFIVEVEKFTDLFDKFSGFGLKRDKRWFAMTYFEGSLSSDVSAIPEEAMNEDRADSWPSNQKNPWRLTEFQTRWQTPSGEQVVEKGTPYIPLDYSRRKNREQTGIPVVTTLIEQFPQLANGWDLTELNFTKAFFDATPIVLQGRLRLMPTPLKSLFWKVPYSSRSADDMLRRADQHIAWGRLPIIQPQTKEELRRRARLNDQ